jgi:acyl-homoserine-lactone acylase
MNEFRRFFARQTRNAVALSVVLLTFAAAPAVAAPPEKGTEILWDTYGIPHIYAPDHPSLFFAYGYAQMEGHAELLIRLYAQARGRAAEFYGDSYVDSDRWVRVNGIPERAKQWAAQQTPTFAPLIEAFAAGLNAWATEHRNLLSEQARGMLPLTAVDVYAHGMRNIQFGWLTSAGNVEQRARQATLVDSGSNGWAIAPSKTATGNAMLLSNSHLSWFDRNTYMEVQLTAPGVTSYGAVWVGFPVLRQNFTEYVAWTQTTNGPTGADLYKLTLRDGGYVLDGTVRQFDVEQQVIKVREPDGSLRDVPLTIKRSVHGPVVVEREGITAALRVAPASRPRMFEQYWNMSLAKNVEEWKDAMRMQQWPIFHTMYADRDGHIMYVYNTAPPKRTTGDHAFWRGVVPGDQSALIPNDEIVPFDQIPQVMDPPTGWVQNCNDSPWTSTYPMTIKPEDYAPYVAPTEPSLGARAMRSIRLLSESGKISFENLRDMKLSTRSEIADHFVDDLVAAGRKSASATAREAAEILAKWDRQGERNSDGTLLFLRFMQAGGNSLRNIGGYAVPADARQPLTTPRGFADPAKAAALLDTVAKQLVDEYGTMHVLWGDVVRLRRGILDLPGNGMPSSLGGIRTISLSQFDDGTAEIQGGDSFYAVIEFQKDGPPKGEALIGYGNWSREGSKHRTDQLALASQKRMRPILRVRAEIEKNLESRKVF